MRLSEKGLAHPLRLEMDDFDEINETDLRGILVIKKWAQPLLDAGMSEEAVALMLRRYAVKLQAEHDIPEVLER